MLRPLIASLFLTSIIHFGSADIAVSFKVKYLSENHGWTESTGIVFGTNLIVSHDGRIQTDDDEGCTYIDKEICYYRGASPLNTAKLQLFATASLWENRIVSRCPVAAEKLEIPDKRKALPGVLAGMVLVDVRHCKTQDRVWSPKNDSVEFECQFGRRHARVTIYAGLNRRLPLRLDTYQRREFMLAVPLSFYAYGSRRQVIADVFGILKLPQSKTVDRNKRPVPLKIHLDIRRRKFTVEPGPPIDWAAVAAGRRQPPDERYSLFAPNGVKAARPTLITRNGVSRVDYTPAYILYIVYRVPNPDHGKEGPSSPRLVNQFEPIHPEHDLTPSRHKIGTDVPPPPIRSGRMPIDEFSYGDTALPASPELQEFVFV